MMKATYEIQKAKIEDAALLTALSIQSKDYWNYGEEQINAWRSDLTLTSAYIKSAQVFKLISLNKTLGFYSFYQEKHALKTLRLDFFFLNPEFIGLGYGKILMLDFLKRIEGYNADKVFVDSDPNARQFYEKFGFKVIENKPTAIANRFLPVMQLNLKRVQHSKSRTLNP